MNTQTIHAVAVINDFLFQEMLFSSEGQQTRIPFTKARTLSVQQIIDHLIDFFADARPGWEGSMLSSRAIKDLRKTIEEKLQRIHE